MLLMKSIAQEVAPLKIRVNSICPSARRGARFCQIGLYGKAIPFDQDAVCYKELVVTGTNASVTPAWTRAPKLLDERRVDARRLISQG